MKKSNLILMFGVAVFLGIVIAESLNQDALTGSTLLAAVVTALVTGSIYAIAASGLVVTYQTSGVFNLAYGAQAYASALIFYVCVHAGWPSWAGSST